MLDIIVGLNRRRFDHLSFGRRHSAGIILVPLIGVNGGIIKWICMDGCNSQCLSACFCS